LLHKTTRDFLENFVKRVNSPQLGEIEIESTAAHAHLAEICVRYLFLDQAFYELEELLLSASILSEYQQTVADFLRRYPFLCYATESWAYHLQAISSPSHQLSELTQQLLASGEAQSRDNETYLLHQLPRESVRSDENNTNPSCSLLQPPLAS
jgi:oligoendopeptidase F